MSVMRKDAEVYVKKNWLRRRRRRRRSDSIINGIGDSQCFSIMGPASQPGSPFPYGGRGGKTGSRGREEE